MKIGDDTGKMVGLSVAQLFVLLLLVLGFQCLKLFVSIVVLINKSCPHLYLSGSMHSSLGLIGSDHSSDFGYDPSYLTLSINPIVPTYGANEDARV